jgi:hypothetical protein
MRHSRFFRKKKGRESCFNNKVPFPLSTKACVDDGMDGLP